MTRILRIDASPRGRAAHSARLADELVGRLLATTPGASVVHRALADRPPALIDAPFAAAMREHQTAAAAEGVQALALSETLIRELETTDVLVLSTPMHNYTVPASLKAWIDQVVRFGRTFRSTPEGKVGLLADRPAYVVLSAGGYFSDERARQPDFLTPYLEAILTTIGIRDLRLIRLEGLTRGDAALAEAWSRARADVERLTARA